MIALPPVLSGLRWLVATAALAGAALWVLGWRADLIEQGRAEVRVQWQAERAMQLEQALERERETLRTMERQERQAQEVDRVHQSQLRASRAAAADARSELDRLRDALARAGGGGAGDVPEATTDPGGAAGAAAAIGLFAACAERYADVAAVADRLADQLRGLQALIAP